VINLNDYAQVINSALADGTPCLLATNGTGEPPDIGFKGSMIVFDQDRLAYWERSAGRHLKNVQANPGVAVLYFNRERGKYLRLFGEAELHEGDAVRDQVMARIPELELNMDPERKGIAVLVRVDRLQEAFGQVTASRD